MSIKEALKAFYLEYCNDFLTVTCIAERYGLEFYEAYELIKLGEKYHELAVKVT